MVIALIYIHGFASSGDTPKTAELKARFPDEMVLSPTLDHHPDVAMDALDRIIGRLIEAGETEFVLVGSSLGGFYANYVGGRYDIPRVLINPAILPSITLRPMLGEVTNLATGETFLWEEDQLKVLAFVENKIKMWGFAKDVRYKATDVVIARDDNVIDVPATIGHFTSRKANLHVFDEGGHRFNNMEVVYDLIAQRLATIRSNKDFMDDVDI